MAHSWTVTVVWVPFSRSFPLKCVSLKYVQCSGWTDSAPDVVAEGDGDGASVAGRVVGLLDIGDHVGGLVGTELTGEPDGGVRAAVVASVGDNNIGAENEVGTGVSVSGALVVFIAVGTEVGSEVAGVGVGSEVGGGGVKVGPAVGSSIFVAQQRAENVAWASGWHDLAPGCADEPNEMR